MSQRALSGPGPEAGGRAGPAPARPGARRRTFSVRRRRSAAAALVLLLPAAFFYVIFVLRPIAYSVQYSLYEWNGVGEARSEERRVGKECGIERWQGRYNKKYHGSVNEGQNRENNAN